MVSRAPTSDCFQNQTEDLSKGSFCPENCLTLVIFLELKKILLSSSSILICLPLPSRSSVCQLSPLFLLHCSLLFSLGFFSSTYIMLCSPLLWLIVCVIGASLVAQLVKNPPAMQETSARLLGWEDPLEKGKATHSSILAWRIPWTIQSMGLQRVGHDWATFTFTFIMCVISD